MAGQSSVHGGIGTIFVVLGGRSPPEETLAPENRRSLPSRPVTQGFGLVVGNRMARF